MTSVAAPGPVGTINLMGRLGQLCAEAGTIGPSTTMQSSVRKSIFIEATDDPKVLLPSFERMAGTSDHRMLMVGRRAVNLQAEWLLN
jgi:hypothetical protein